MDARRSFYLASRQDDFDMPAQDNQGRVDFMNVPYVPPANDPAASGPRSVVYVPFVGSIGRFRTP